MHIVSTFRLICRILDWWPLGELQFKFTASFISPNFFHWEIKPRGDRNKWWDSSWFKESVLSTHESVFRELRARIRNNKTLLNRMTLAKQIWLSILMQSFIWLFYFSLSLSNGATAQGGPRPPLGVSSLLPGLGRLLSSFYILASLHLPPLHLPNAVWVSLWGVFLLAHWEELSWIDHHHPDVWHVLLISVYSTCTISQCHSHHTVDKVLGWF